MFKWYVKPHVQITFIHYPDNKAKQYSDHKYKLRPWLSTEIGATVYQRNVAGTNDRRSARYQCGTSLNERPRDKLVAHNTFCNVTQWASCRPLAAPTIIRMWIHITGFMHSMSYCPPLWTDHRVLNARWNVHKMKPIPCASRK